MPCPFQQEPFSQRTCRCTSGIPAHRVSSVFAAEDRGARDVLATDHFCWGGPGWGTKAGFDLAKKARGSAVRDREVDIPEHTVHNPSSNRPNNAQRDRFIFHAFR